MHANKPIVVGIDGSSSAIRAARWTATEAQRRGLPLRLVHAYEIPDGYPPGIVDASAVRAGFEELGRQHVTAAREAIADVAPELPVELALVRGPSVPVLVHESLGATEVVLGTRGLGGFSGLLIGSTAVALAGRAHCPVLVIRGRHADEEPPEAGPVVVGVDGTPANEAAIAFAFGHAATHDRQLIAVHAWTDTPLEADLASWPEKYPQVKVTREIVRDRPAPALLSYAAGAALVVVGTRGRGGFRGLLLGSTSQHLLQHAPCPVAVVRTDVAVSGLSPAGDE